MAFVLIIVFYLYHITYLNSQNQNEKKLYHDRKIKTLRK